MTESFTKSDNKQKSVVLLEYPRKGVWAVGFATKENEGLIKKNKRRFDQRICANNTKSYERISSNSSKK